MFRSLSVIVMCALAPVSAFAAESLTLEAALREALEGNQAVLNSGLQRESAEAGVLSAKGVFDPQLELAGNLSSGNSRDIFQGFVFDSNTLAGSGSSSIRGQLETGTSYQATGRWGTSENTTFGSFIPELPPSEQKTTRSNPSINLGVGQELLRGYRTAYNRRQVVEAVNAFEIADLQLVAQQQRTMRDVASAYWAWSNAVEGRKISEDRVTIAIEALRVGRLQLQEGRIAPVDVSRLQTELVRAEKALADAKQMDGETGDTLATLMGRRPGVELDPGTPFSDAAPSELTVDSAIEAVLAGNLDLAVVRRQAEQSVLATKLARHAMLPSLSIDGSLNFSQVRVTADGESTDPVPNQTLAGSATFSVPLGNRAARGEMARAGAVQAQRKNELAGQERQLAAQAAKQVRVINNAAEQVRLADQEVILADQTLQAEEARANAGRAVQKDVLEARTSLFNAQIQAAKARTDRQLALVELLLLQGNLSIESVVP